ncbi:hypothetical protein HAX54_003576 [Datura stramonium]|uniref:Uncharacterized protein n=1 Tax=Datura stramonium TaxID=4076 RepID=A0ABS8WWU4_DATST|nr:hypothetical protein [Datura stramonium]
MSSIDFESNWKVGIDDYSGDDCESDAKSDGRDMYYNSYDESGGYDDSNTSQTYDESHQICDLSKSITFMMNIVVVNLLIMMRLVMVMNVLMLELGVQSGATRDATRQTFGAMRGAAHFLVRICNSNSTRN